MEWVSFTSGVIATLFTYALLTSQNDTDIEEDDLDEEVEGEDFSVRHVILSCQTCRKLKRHKEIEHNMFQCVKCKRHVDLRVS
ncbi:hypothetical protein [Metabacillus litoralis]|uniref:hypothetical protein n=1 Tax=Metabacillus litoralis TaxID=152268 RepID=UPI00203D2CDA|nr:hypothetical protein [Metabacillus litoralis]MCM3411444.1 hypothetical protein [Metabacillus litoralis]